MENLNVLPLAITMMAGAALMAAIIFVTHPRATQIIVCGIFIALILN